MWADRMFLKKRKLQSLTEHYFLPHCPACFPLVPKLSPADVSLSLGLCVSCLQVTCVWKVPGSWIQSGRAAGGSRSACRQAAAGPPCAPCASGSASTALPSWTPWSKSASRAAAWPTTTPPDTWGPWPQPSSRPMQSTACPPWPGGRGSWRCCHRQKPTCGSPTSLWRRTWRNGELHLLHCHF